MNYKTTTVPPTFGVSNYTDGGGLGGGLSGFSKKGMGGGLGGFPTDGGGLGGYGRHGLPNILNTFSS